MECTVAEVRRVSAGQENVRLDSTAVISTADLRISIMTHHNSFRVFLAFFLAVVSLGWANAGPEADDAIQNAPTSEQPLLFDIEHPKTTIPLPGVKLYSMPHVWDGRIDTRLAMTQNGHLYAGCGYLWKSTDRGQTWTYRKLPVFGGGWTQIYQHPNGTAMMTVTLRHSDKCFEEWDNPQVRGVRDHVFRSTDGGKTWRDRTLLAVHGCESSLFAPHGSDKMLAYIRVQRGLLPTDPPDLTQKTGSTKGWPVKSGVIAESHDRGRTWQRLRLFDTLGSVPGEIIQTPDGRIAAVWMQRYPYEDSEIRVRISDDLGQPGTRRPTG